MIVAGEPSGDRHAARLVEALREGRPDDSVRFFGAAGPRMRAAGVEAVVESDHFAIVGLPEIARALPMFLRAFQHLKKAALERPPDVVILVDFPDFNLKLAKALKKQGFKVVYYISPQLWAWRRYRVNTIKRFVDLLITILPFEKEWYEGQGYERVEYVGNPLALNVVPSQDRAGFCREHGLDSARPIISLLPGSRGKELSRIFPVMLRAAARVNDVRPDVQFVVPVAHQHHRENVESMVVQARLSFAPLVCVDETYNALTASDAAAITSGTATLEAGILNTPMAIVYRSSAINYVLLRPLISVEHFGLINLIAGRRLAKELIQMGFTDKTLSDELLHLLDPAVNASFRSELKQAAEKLGEGGASDRAAAAVWRIVGS